MLAVHAAQREPAQAHQHRGERNGAGRQQQHRAPPRREQHVLLRTRGHVQGQVAHAAIGAVAPHAVDAAGSGDLADGRAGAHRARELAARRQAEVAGQFRVARHRVAVGQVERQRVRRLANQQVAKEGGEVLRPQRHGDGAAEAASWKRAPLHEIEEQLPGGAAAQGAADVPASARVRAGPGEVRAIAHVQARRRLLHDVGGDGPAVLVPDPHGLQLAQVRRQFAQQRVQLGGAGTQFGVAAPLHRGRHAARDHFVGLDDAQRLLLRDLHDAHHARPAVEQRRLACRDAHVQQHQEGGQHRQQHGAAQQQHRAGGGCQARLQGGGRTACHGLRRASLRRRRAAVGRFQRGRGADARKPARGADAAAGEGAIPRGRAGARTGGLGVARLAGIEPTTLGFGGQYSIH